MLSTRYCFPLPKPIIFLPMKILSPKIVILESNASKVMSAYGTIKWPKFFGTPPLIDKLYVREDHVSDKELEVLISSLASMVFKLGYTRCALNLEKSYITDQKLRVLKQQRFEPVSETNMGIHMAKDLL